MPSLKSTGLMCHCGSLIHCEMLGEGTVEFYCGSCGAMYNPKIVKQNMNSNASRLADDHDLFDSPRLTYDQLLAGFDKNQTPP